MSSYWDAVSRAALGVAGSAAPRPRSRFEPDSAERAGASLEAIDDVQLAPPPSPPLHVEHARAATTGEPAAAADAPARLAHAVTAAPSAERELARVARAAPGDADAAADIPGSPAAPGADRAPRAEEPVRPPSAIDPGVPVVESRILVATTVASTEREVPPGEARSDVVAPHEHPRLDRDAPEPEPALAAPPEPPDRPADQVVALTADPVAAPPALPLAPAVEQPPLVVEIEHLEIRIEPDRREAPAPTQRRTDDAAIPSLREYLAGRSEARP